MQAVALAEEDGLRTGNAYGHVPFADPQVPEPLVKDGDGGRHLISYHPRDGSRSPWTSVPRTAAARFTPPTPGELLDWVLVLESRSP